MDTDSIYSKLNISHDEYLKILEKNIDLFGKNIGLMEPECIDNPIKEFISLSSKCYSYICKNDNNSKTNTIVKNNIEFLNDKRYISDINVNIPHTLYIE